MSLGNKLGRGVGITGALLVHGAHRAAIGAGRFGEDFVAGVETGYEEKAAALVLRNQRKAAEFAAAVAKAQADHAAAMAATVAVTPAVEPVPAPTGKRAVKV